MDPGWAERQAVSAAKGASEGGGDEGVKVRIKWGLL